jgi:hypothetical protein
VASVTPITLHCVYSSCASPTLINKLPVGALLLKIHNPNTRLDFMFSWFEYEDDWRFLDVDPCNLTDYSLCDDRDSKHF